MSRRTLRRAAALWVGKKKPTSLQWGVGQACRLKKRFILDVAYPNSPRMQVWWVLLLQHAPPVLWLQWEDMPWMTVEPVFIGVWLDKGVLSANIRTDY